MSRIMVLPGTKWQIPLIQAIKKMGHEVFLVNPTPNPGIVGLADQFFPSDIFSLDEIEKYAKENRINAVISDECDIATPVVAELGKRLHVQTLSCETAALFTNKFLMQEFGKTIGLDCFEYDLCKTDLDAIKFLHSLDHPIILKPLDSNASHGVFKAETEQEVREHFKESLSFSQSQKVVLAERYVEGTEFTIDGIKTPDHHYTLAISEKKHYSHNENIANELFFSHSSELYDYDKLKEINDHFVMNSDLTFGLTHAEYKYQDGTFYLLEIGARGGGNMISSIIAPFMSGHDTYEYLISCSLGNYSSKDFSVLDSCRNRVALLKFFDVPRRNGVVQEILGTDYLEKEPDIKDYALSFSIGDRLKTVENDSERIGYYIVCSETKEKLLQVMKRIDESFEIVVR